MQIKLAPFAIPAVLLSLAACDRPAAPSADAPVIVDAAAPPSASQAAEVSVPAAVSSGPGAALPAARLVITDRQVEAEYSGGIQKCLGGGDAAKGVSVAMGACFNTELQAQDARLNSVYRRVISELDEAGRAQLREEERDWIRERDIGCREAATGGTIDLVEIPSCLLSETVRRRLVLESLPNQR